MCAQGQYEVFSLPSVVHAFQVASSVLRDTHHIGRGQPPHGMPTLLSLSMHTFSRHRTHDKQDQNRWSAVKPKR